MKVVHPTTSVLLVCLTIGAHVPLCPPVRLPVRLAVRLPIRLAVRLLVPLPVYPTVVVRPNTVRGSGRTVNTVILGS